MEGRLLRYLKTTRIEWVGCGFFCLCLLAGLLLLTYLSSDDESPRGVPKQYTEQPDPGVQDFYTPEKDCRLSIDRHKKHQGQSLDAWIDTDREQLTALTVLSREKKQIDHDEKKILYTIVSAETGMSKIYYEDRGNEIFEMRVFGEHKRCYMEFETFILSL